MMNFSIHGKIRTVPNHQPNTRLYDMIFYCIILYINDTHKPRYMSRDRNACTYAYAACAKTYSHSYRYHLSFHIHTHINAYMYTCTHPYVHTYAYPIMYPIIFIAILYTYICIYTYTYA